MTRERSTGRPNIDEVRARFDGWRQTRQGRLASLMSCGLRRSRWRAGMA
jgi:hypothetical protein